jgi:predicted nuclease with TOPRIM domain
MVMAIERVSGETLAKALHDGTVRDMPSWMLLEASAEVERLTGQAERATELSESVESLEAEAAEDRERIAELETRLMALEADVSDRDTLIENLKNGYDGGETVRLQAEMIELLQARVARLTAWLPADKRRKLGMA